MSMPTGFGPELRELDRVARQALAIHPTQRPDFAALLQSHALHRLADALAPLERIAAAMEAKVVEREPAESATTPDEREAAMKIRQEEARQSQVEPQSPPWITDHLPSESVGFSGWVQVRAGGIFASFDNGDCVRIKPWSAVATGEAWAPLDKTKLLFCWTSDAIPWQEFLAASSSASSEDPEPATTPDESEAAMEIREAAAFGLCTPQKPPQSPPATPGGHPLDQGGWIRSRRPTQADANADGEVVVLSACGHWGYVFWHLVGFGQPWSGADVDSLPPPPPLPAHVAFPTSEGWIHDRLPGPEDGDGGGVVIPASGDTGYIHWSYVVPGQPWRHSPFYMP